MGMPAARMTDFHMCPMVTGTVPHVGGPCMGMGFTVLIGKKPAARMGDPAICTGPPDSLLACSPTVSVQGSMQCRMLDATAHGGMIMVGEFTVLVG